MAIKPLADRVVAKKDAAVEQTASGILLGEAKEKQNTAVVESIGPDVKNVQSLCSYEEHTQLTSE